MIKIMTQKEYRKELMAAVSLGRKLGYAIGRAEAHNEMWAEFHPSIPQVFIKAFENDNLDNFETGCR